jgi:hypothetical protein
MPSGASVMKILRIQKTNKARTTAAWRTKKTGIDFVKYKYKK